MLASRYLPSADEIRLAIKATESFEDHAYAAVFRDRHNIDSNLGWDFLAQLFGFRFKPSDSADPFGPMLVMDGKRSMIPDDLTEEQLIELRTALNEVDDPEFKARIGDVLWLRSRDAAAARVAVEAYLEAGMRIEDPEHWSSGMERYERAVRLARQVEPRGNLPKRALAHLEGRVKHYNGTDPLYFTFKALKLLEEFGFGDFALLAEIAGRVARQSRLSQDFRRAREYYSVQARLLKREKDQIGAEGARVAAAETYAEEAEAQEASGSFIAARVFWQDALNAFRERPALRDRIPDLHKRLTVAGEKTLGEMKTHSVELDLSKPVEEAKAAIMGHQKDDALFRFIMLVGLLDPGKL